MRASSARTAASLRLLVMTANSRVARSSGWPTFSSAARVLSKSGGAGLAAMASISARQAAMARVSAGSTSSMPALPKAGRPP
jgi:hypothetical protein